jgi:hypothetical protein
MPVALEMLKVHTTQHVVVRAGVDALLQLAIAPENRDKMVAVVPTLLVAMKGGWGVYVYVRGWAQRQGWRIGWHCAEITVHLECPTTCSVCAERKLLLVLCPLLVRQLCP